MSFFSAVVRYGKLVPLVLVVMVLLTGCGDNLVPSGKDKRSPVAQGISGYGVGQKMPDFSVSDTRGVFVNLSSALTGRKGAVFYFTMWCPICDSHMSHMRSSTIPLFPGVGFYAVDYVSGSVSDAAGNASANGYGGGEFTVLADTGHQLLNGFQATMGTTVLMDSSGTILMNEDYRDGSRLNAMLATLP
jgi:peroxiredoxin